MNITNFINIYMQIYIPILYMTKMTQKIKLVLSTIIVVYYFLLQDFHILSVSQIMEMEGSYHLLSYKN